MKVESLGNKWKNMFLDLIFIALGRTSLVGHDVGHKSLPT